MFEDSALELLNSGKLLEDRAWLAAALERWGVRRTRRIEPADVDALRRLRELLRRLTARTTTGAQLDGPELAELNAVLAATPVRAQLVAQPGGGYLVDMEPVARDWVDAAVCELAGSFSSMLRRAHPPRVRLCESCGAAFWDGSRNRARRWCDSRLCGNRVRVARHRARHRAS